MKTKNPDEMRFYIYLYFDQRTEKLCEYNEFRFKYEPFYVGKGSGPRFKHHLKSNKYNRMLHYKIKKIQEQTKKDPVILKIIENLTEMEAFEIERHMIKTIGRKDLNMGPLCNMTDGGDGYSGRTGFLNHFYGKHHSHETIERIRDANKGEKSWSHKMKGRNHPNRGRKHSEETKRNMSKSQSGIKNQAQQNGYQKTDLNVF